MLSVASPEARRSPKAPESDAVKARQQTLVENAFAICNSSGLITPVEDAERGVYWTKWSVACIRGD